MLGIDLHTHSHFSDGELSPQALIARAVEVKIHTLALTDHDNIDGYLAAREAAAAAHIHLISGVELSCQWTTLSSKKPIPLHIVALNMQHLQPIETLLKQQQLQRAERAHLIIQKLEKILNITLLDEIRVLVNGCDDRITRSHIAQVLMHNGIIQRQQQAFDRFLGLGKAAYVAFDGIAMPQAIEIIHQAGGVAVLAHPTKYDLSSTKIRSLIADFAAHGGDAIELPAASEAFATRHMIDRLVASHDLKVSIGSDFHGSHMPWMKLGNVPKLAAGQVGIWQQFKAS